MADTSRRDLFDDTNFGVTCTVVLEGIGPEKSSSPGRFDSTLWVLTIDNPVIVP